MSSPTSRFLRLVVVLFTTSLFFACTGDQGPQGPAGETGAQGAQGDQGDQGPPGTNGAVPIDSTSKINVISTEVSIPVDGAGVPGAPVVKFTLINDLTQGLFGLQAGEVGFVLSQLSEAPAGSGSSSEWQAYTTRDSGGIPDAQASTESGASKLDPADPLRFVDNGDGTYMYTYLRPLNDYPAGPLFDQNKSHRLGIEIRGQAPISSNGIYDFVPSAPGMDPTVTRAIVDNDTCNACHDVFGFHGGPRTDITYCVTCHNPSSIDGDTVNEAWGGTVDMKQMIHKIHFGINLTQGYFIIGHRNTLHDYSNVIFPQDVRNCGTCHDETNTNTPDSDNWKTLPNRAACGACHDAIDWAGGGHPGGLMFDNDEACASCHAEGSTVNGGALQVSEVHRIPQQEASQRFQYNIVNILNTAIGERPVVEFSVTDPTNNDAPYDIQNDPEFTTCAQGASRLAIGMAWNTGDYNNVDTGVSPGLPISMNPLTACGGASAVVGGGVFSVTAPIDVPATATGSLAVTIDGHPAVVIDGVTERIAVTNAVDYAPITDAEAVKRRNAVAIEKCDDCHNALSMHGNNRTDNIEVCVTCHAPNVTDVNRRGGDCLTDLGPDDQTVDMKRMIHAIHASGAIGVPFEVCGFGNRTHIYDFVYPGKLNNCEGCHLPGGYYPVDPTKVLGTTVDVSMDVASPTDDVVISPNSSVCSSCHVSDLAKTHMEQNGGDFAATKAADGTLISSGSETCELCHGPGKSVDVGVMHGVGEFQSN